MNYCPQLTYAVLLILLFRHNITPVCGKRVLPLREGSANSGSETNKGRVFSDRRLSVKLHLSLTLSGGKLVYCTSKPYRVKLWWVGILISTTLF